MLTADYPWLYESATMRECVVLLAEKVSRLLCGPDTPELRLIPLGDAAAEEERAHPPVREERAGGQAYSLYAAGCHPLQTVVVISSMNPQRPI